MVDTKLIILIAPVILVGCATTPMPVAIPEPLPIIEYKGGGDGSVMPSPVVEAPTQEQCCIRQNKSAPIEAFAALSANTEQTVAIISKDVAAPKPVKKKEKFIDKVTSSVMSVAEAAIADKKETITYDANGDIKEKSVEVDKGSFVDNITKLFGLITATLGLYIGVKKFRHPDPEKV